MQTPSSASSDKLDAASTAASDSKSCCRESDSAASRALPELDLPRASRSTPWRSAPDANAAGESGTADAIANRAPIATIHRRWDRFVRLVGEPAVHRLLNSHVAIFGLGGVGSHAAEALARSAIGSFTLVDFDDVCVTNINRQLHAFPATIGKSKAGLMAERLRAIHPEATIRPVQEFYDADSSSRLLTPRPDLVIDAIDNVTAKLHLLETCLRNQIPVVSSTGSGARLDPTMVRVADLSQTSVDPLARTIRRELGKRGWNVDASIGIPTVFSREDVREPEMPSWDAERGFQCICPHRADSPHACEKRRVIYGTASFVTAAFGLAAASVAVRQLVAMADSSRAEQTRTSSG